MSDQHEYLAVIEDNRSFFDSENYLYPLASNPETTKNDEITEYCYLDETNAEIYEDIPGSEPKSGPFSPQLPINPPPSKKWKFKRNWLVLIAIGSILIIVAIIIGTSLGVIVERSKHVQITGDITTAIDTTTAFYTTAVTTVKC